MKAASSQELVQLKLRADWGTSDCWWRRWELLEEIYPAEGRRHRVLPNTYWPAYFLAEIDRIPHVNWELKPLLSDSRDLSLTGPDYSSLISLAQIIKISCLVHWTYLSLLTFRLHVKCLGVRNKVYQNSSFPTLMFAECFWYQNSCLLPTWRNFRQK